MASQFKVVDSLNAIIANIENLILLYPNPTNNLITVDINGYNCSFNIEIYDLQGRLLETTNKTTISLKKDSKGIYVFRASYGDKTEEMRVLRQ
ncbi:MAG: T9SS type A sorting domain-containing protein [Crocinitomix sp.]|nr:T9SS type A sorting domain-containing protein [Crocinitomix sp.]